MLGSGEPSSRPRQGTRGAAGCLWVTLHPRIPPESSISSVQLSSLPPWILVGMGRGGWKPHLATIPWDPAWGVLGLSSLWGPRGRLAQAAGSGRLGQEGAEQPVGPWGKIWGGTEFPDSGRGPERGGVLATWPPEQLQTGEWSSQGPGSPCGDKHRLVIADIESDQITRGHPPMLPLQNASFGPQNKTSHPEPSLSCQ